MPTSSFQAFVDESSAQRPAQQMQEYLICATVIEESMIDSARESVRSLRRPGQLKLHWTDESAASRRSIVKTIAELEHINAVVTYLSAPAKKTERFRRKCLETLYYEAISLDVSDLILESRTASQDQRDITHIASLKAAGMSKKLHISHRRGRDEPLLWLPDIVLGAINANHLGESRYLDCLRDSFIFVEKAAGSA